jgi:His-Xaa-Ser system radical SAM maturase HxsC
MIPLGLAAVAEAERPYVARLRTQRHDDLHAMDALLIEDGPDSATFAGVNGLVTIEGLGAAALDGDIVLVQPDAHRVERLLRAGSPHNTLLATERCDQLCVMCSQPPKKTHVDRFDLFEEACLLAEPDSVIGISGGEPTLYKDALLGMMERVLASRPDLEFHVLTNAQHFEPEDVPRLRDPVYRGVFWGIPLYASDADLHDRIVGKTGAYARLMSSFAALLRAGARVELRTVLVRDNLPALPKLARLVTAKLRFIDAWSIMQLENIGFAKNRWPDLYVDHRVNFAPIATALDHAALHGVPARLFNFPRCTVPDDYRDQAAASISDWKRKYAPACAKCSVRKECCGFFEWHPDDAMVTGVQPL